MVHRCYDGIQRPPFLGHVICGSVGPRALGPPLRVPAKNTISELESSGANLARLVCGKAHEIFSEFDDVLHSRIWGPLTDRLPERVQRSDIAELCVDLCTHHALSYHRRVIMQVESFTP